jgi:hypothetical protein
MPQYLVAGYLPDDFDPSQADEAMGRDIHALNIEMIAAGVRVYACGLYPASNAKSLRPQPDGLITDGPYLETKGPGGGLGAQRHRRHPGAGRGARDLLQSANRLATERHKRGARMNCLPLTSVGPS